jgi:hypothetical protein
MADWARSMTAARSRRDLHDRPDPEPPGPAPPRQQEVAGPADILALQRGYGNRAVASALLARQPVPPAAGVDTPETSYDNAVTQADWDQAARAFQVMNPDPKKARLESASTQTLLRVSQAAERLGIEDVRNEFAAKLKEPKHATAAANILRDDEFYAARGPRDWPRMVRALAAFDDAGMKKRLEFLTLEDELFPLSAAARLQLPAMDKVFAAIETVRVRKLGEAYADAWQHDDYARAVRLVEAYNDLDIGGKLEEIDTLERLSAVTAQAKAMAAHQRVFKFAEPIRIKRLIKEYDAAVAGSDWSTAAILLNAFNDIDLDARIKAIKAAGKIADLDAAAVAQTPKIGTRVHRHISFLLHAPAALTGNRSDYTVTTAGTDKHTKIGVGGGEVHARTGVGFKVGGVGPEETGGYELEYKGADAQKTHWLQFIHRIIKSDKAGPPATTTYLDAEVASSAAGSYRLTTDPARPFYNTDSAVADSPFYHAGGVSLRDPTKDTMLDAPSAAEDFVATAFRAGADKVTSYANFNTYLVRDMDVLYRVDISQRWEFDKATHWDDATKTVTSIPGVKSEVTGGTAVSALAKGHRDRLLVQYPNFDYLP